MIMSFNFEFNNGHARGVDLIIMSPAQKILGIGQNCQARILGPTRIFLFFGWVKTAILVINLTEPKISEKPAILALTPTRTRQNMIRSTKE